jgi:hypothetical protein
LLPPSFQSFEARFNIAFASQVYCDLQQEICPYLVKKGNSVLAQIDNLGVKAQEASGRIVLAGYYPTGKAYLDERTTQSINESLADEPSIETFSFTVDEAGQKSYILQNDRYARLILGFSVTDLETNKANLASSLLKITDFARKIKFNDVPIPIEYFAPRLTCLRDTHIYYLPVEAFFEPLNALRFEMDTDLNGGAGFEFTMVTRKV